MRRANGSPLASLRLDASNGCDPPAATWIASSPFELREWEAGLLGSFDSRYRAAPARPTANSAAAPRIFRYRMMLDILASVSDASKQTYFPWGLRPQTPVLTRASRSLRRGLRFMPPGGARYARAPASP